MTDASWPDAGALSSMFLNSQLPSLQGTLLLDIFLCQDEKKMEKKEQSFR